MRLVAHIGLHKTATTWFQRRFLPAMAEDGVRVAASSRAPWDDELLRHLVLGEGNAVAAHDLLLDRVGDASTGVLSAERLSGHPAANWWDAALIAERLAALHPDLQVLIVLRDQVTHVPSVYAQLVSVGWTGSVAELLDDDPSAHWKRPRLGLSGFEHDRRVATLFELLGRDRVTVLRHERLVTDPAAFVRRVLAVLVPDGTSPRRFEELLLTTETTVHPTRRRSLGLDRVLNHLRTAPLQPSPAVNLGRLVASAPMQWLVEHWPGGRALLEGEHDDLLRERFAASNARLEALLDESAA